MDSIAFLKTQMHRMNGEQRKFVEVVASLPAGASLTKTDEERIAQMYLWLHMDSGSIAKRQFTSSLGVRKHRPRRG